jgi:hypothetical protein
MFAIIPAVSVVLWRLCPGDPVLLCEHWQLSTASMKGDNCCRMQPTKRSMWHAIHEPIHVNSALLIYPDHQAISWSLAPSPYTSGVGHLMQLLPRQSLARLQHFLTANRRLAAPHKRCEARHQASIQQLCPAAASVPGAAAPLCVTGAQLCTQRFSNHLQPLANISRFHTTRQVAARSTANASGETDSVAAVKRLVSLHVTRSVTQWAPLRQA